MDTELFLRAVLIAAIGFAITFTAPLHENLAFNRAVFVVLCAGLVALGVLRVALSRRQRGEQPSVVGRSAVLLAAVALLAGIATLVTSAESSFTLIVILWATLGALLEGFIGLRTGNRDSVMAGALSGILAVALSFASADLVAVIGFLGAYGILTGVYLAIAAFDFSPAPGTEPASANPLDTETAGS